MAGNQEAYRDAMRAGHALAREKNWTGAANEYRRAIAEFPNDIVSHTSLAMVWFRLGSLEQSLAELEFVQRLAPEDARVAQKVAEIRAALGPPPRAEAAPLPPRPVAQLTTPPAAPAPHAARGQEAMLSALAGRRHRASENGVEPRSGAIAGEVAGTVPALLGAIVTATTAKERVARFQELMSLVGRTADPTDPADEFRSDWDTAARAGVLALARARTGRLAAGATGERGGAALISPETDVPLEELEELPEDAQLRAVMALGRSRVLIDSGRFIPAIDECESAIETAPGLLPLHVRLAEALQRQGRRSAALALFNSVADVYQAREAPDRALASLREAVRLSPDNPSLRNKLARLLLELDRPDEALGEHLALSEHYVALGQPDRAVEEYRRTIQTFPQSVEALVAFGRALSRLGRSDDASEAFTRAWSMEPENPSAAAHYLTIHAEVQWDYLRAALESIIDAANREDARLPAALRVLEDAAELYPESGPLNCAAGVTLVAAGQPDRAIRFLELAVMAGGGPAADAQPFLARAKLAIGRADEALQTLDSSEFDPDDLDAAAIRAEAYVQQENWQQAEPLLRRLVVEVDSPVVYWQLTRVEAHLGELDDALAAIESADPADSSEELFAAVGAIEVMAHEADEPWDYLRRLATWYRGRAMNRPAAQALDSAAESLAGAGHSAEAASVWNEAIDLVRGRDMEFALHLRERLAHGLPADLGARQGLINAYMNMGRATEAIAEARAAADQLQAAGDLPNAAKMLRQITQLDPWDREALLALGEALLELHDDAEAERTFERLVRIVPEHPEAQEYLRRLRGARGG